MLLQAKPKQEMYGWCFKRLQTDEQGVANVFRG